MQADCKTDKADCYFLVLGESARTLEFSRPSKWPDDSLCKQSSLDNVGSEQCYFSWWILRTTAWSRNMYLQP